MLEVASRKIDRFGWERMDEALKDGLVGDWIAVLSKYTLQEVKKGIDDVFRSSSGELRSINEFQVEAKIRQEHGKLLASLPEKIENQPNRDFSKEAVARRRALAESLLGKAVGASVQ